MNTNLFITETWLQPNRSLPTTWTQIHNFGISVDRFHRGQYGISLLISHSSFIYRSTKSPIIFSPVVNAKISSLSVHIYQNNSIMTSALIFLPKHQSTMPTIMNLTISCFVEISTHVQVTIQGISVKIVNIIFFQIFYKTTI